jgi:hypothetical protein
MEGGVNNRERRKAEFLLKNLANVIGLSLDTTPSARGRRFECYCARKAKSLGFSVLSVGERLKPWDLVINGYRVQCKARQKHGHRQHGVYLRKNNDRRYSTNEVDFFAILFNSQCFVIPSSELCDDEGVVCGYVSLADKQHFVDAWMQLCGQRVQVDRQLSMFSGNIQNGQ